MTRPYSPPSVTVSEVIDPTIAPLISPPALLAIVGLSQGAIPRRQLITFRKDDEGEEVAIPLNVPTGSIVTGPVKVEAAVYNSDIVYEEESDYILEISEDPQSAENNAATVKRAEDSSIPSGTAPDFEYSVYVNFDYIPEDYWSPVTLSSYSEVIDRFGSALTEPNDTGEVQINSPLTYAAEVAFENGATEIVCQPLFTGSVSRQPPVDDTNPEDWERTFAALRIIPEVNIVVPVPKTAVNQFNIMQKAQDHVNYMRLDDQQYLIAVLGVDSVSAEVDPVTVRAQATGLSERFGGALGQQTVIVSPSKFIRPYRGTGLVVGGQYMAAAVAGMIAARPVYQSLTRKSVLGFIDVAEARTKAQKNEDAGSGLMVIERRNSRSNVLQIRHAITLDPSSSATRELSVVRAKHRVIESVRDTLDTQIVGQVIADGEAPIIVRNAVAGVLDELRSERDIVTYGDIQSRISNIDPTIVEIRFSYAPAFPVNYINVLFSLDLSSGLITTNEGVTNV